MKLGCIADDFTGASDLANTLAKNGMSTVQFVGVPSTELPVLCDAGVVALKTRSVSVEEAVAKSLEALYWLQEQGCEQFLFKYCSTFDSTPAGNIGPVAEALADALHVKTAIVCPVFPEAGRTMYHGHLFVNGKLLNESGMEKHPLTRMTDPDIRRWLRQQTKSDVGLISHLTVNQGADAIANALKDMEKTDNRLIVVDALSNKDLKTIGRAVASEKLITGGSGIAVGLPENFRITGKIAHASNNFIGLSGPSVVLSGSCSATSLKQVSEYLKKHPGLVIDPSTLVEKRMTAAKASEFVIAHSDQAPIIYSTADVESVAKAQSELGKTQLANTIENFFGDVAKILVDQGFTRIVVGGGETSGAVVSALGLQHLAIGPEIDPGVPVLSTRTKQGSDIRLALKSGNFGSTDFYEKAQYVMEGHSPGL